MVLTLRYWFFIHWRDGCQRIANNSGGALVKRGPAYTELALFGQVNKEGELELVNHLGIEGLGETPEIFLPI